MCKKNYFEPEMEVMELSLSQMLCASVSDEGGEAEDLGPIDDPYVDPNE